jgi:hypothetical protein
VAMEAPDVVGNVACCACATDVQRNAEIAVAANNFFMIIGSSARNCRL